MSRSRHLFRDHPSPWRGALSGLLSLALVLTQCPVSAPAKAEASTPVVEPTRLAPLDLKTFSVPEALGYVVETWQPPHPVGTIFHIQDLHTHVDAQTKIATLIAYLHGAYGIDTVALEGAEGLLDTASYSAVPSRDIRDKVATVFLQHGLFSGPEFFAVTQPGMVTLWGAEDEALYFAHLDAYHALADERAELDEALHTLNQAMQHVTPRLAPASFLTLEQQTSAFEQGGALSEYLRFLTGEAKRHDLVLDAYPHIHRAMSLMELEPQLEHDKIRQATPALLARLRRELTGEPLRKLEDLASTVQPRSATTFYRQLFELTGSQGLALDEPSLTRYERYLSLAASLDHRTLDRELAQITQTLQERMMTTESQRRFLRVRRALRMLDGLYHVTLSPADAAYFDRHRSDFTPEFFERFFTEHAVSLPSLQQASSKLLGRLDTAAEFYRLAAKRDASLTAGALKLLHGRAPIVLVAGGFHTEGLVAAFKERGIAYAVIAPTALDDATDDSLYRARMVREIPDLTSLWHDVHGMLADAWRSNYPLPVEPGTSPRGVRSADGTFRPGVPAKLVKLSLFVALAFMLFASGVGATELSAMWDTVVHAAPEVGKLIEPTLEDGSLVLEIAAFALAIQVGRAAPRIIDRRPSRPARSVATGPSKLVASILIASMCAFGGCGGSQGGGGGDVMAPAPITQPLPPIEPLPTPPPVLADSLGEQRTLAILVRFDDSVHPLVEGRQLREFLDEVSAYYKEQSYGKTRLKVVDVAGPYRIPIAIEKLSSSAGTNRQIIQQEAIRAAHAANPALDFSKVDRLLIYFPFSGNVGGAFGFGTEGKGFVETPDGPVRLSTTWMNGNIGATPHELGHNLGLPHADALDSGDEVITPTGVRVERGDLFDRMGSSSGFYHFNAAHKDRLQWFSPDQLHGIVGQSGTVALTPLETSKPGLKTVKILRDVDQFDSRSWYYLEYRQPIGFDQGLATDPLNLNVTDGVLVHLGFENGQGSQLLDMTPEDRDCPGCAFQNAALTAGQTFTDPTRGIRITPLRVTGDAVTVRVEVPSDVWISSPQEGLVVAGIHRFRINALDDAGMLSGPVSLEKDGRSFAILNTPPFTLDWDTTPERDGSTHTFVARTKNRQGVEQVSPSVTVTVDNRPITFNVFGPSDGAAVSGTLTVYVDAKAPTGIQGVSLEYGTLISTVTRTSPVFGQNLYVLEQDTTSTREGSEVRLIVRVTDRSGTTQTKERHVTVKNQGNRPPVFLPVGPQQAITGVPLRFTVQATDPDNHALTYEVSHAPALSTFHPTTGVFEYTPPHSHAGTHFEVEFIASDGTHFTTMSVPIEVRPGDEVISRLDAPNRADLDYPPQASLSDAEWRAIETLQHEAHRTIRFTLHEGQVGLQLSQPQLEALMAFTGLSADEVRRLFTNHLQADIRVRAEDAQARGTRLPGTALPDRPNPNTPYTIAFGDRNHQVPGFEFDTPAGNHTGDGRFHLNLMNLAHVPRALRPGAIRFLLSHEGMHELTGRGDAIHSWLTPQDVIVLETGRIGTVGFMDPSQLAAFRDALLGTLDQAAPLVQVIRKREPSEDVLPLAAMAVPAPKWMAAPVSEWDRPARQEGEQVPIREEELREGRPENWNLRTRLERLQQLLTDYATRAQANGSAEHIEYSQLLLEEFEQDGGVNQDLDTFLDMSLGTAANPTTFQRTVAEQLVRIARHEGQEVHLFFISPVHLQCWGLSGRLNNLPAGTALPIVEPSGRLSTIILVRTDLSELESLVTAVHEVAHALQGIRAHLRYQEPLLRIITEGFQAQREFEILLELATPQTAFGEHIRTLITSQYARPSDPMARMLSMVFGGLRRPPTLEEQLRDVTRRLLPSTTYIFESRFVDELIGRMGDETPVRLFHRDGTVDALRQKLGEERWQALLAYFRAWADAPQLGLRGLAQRTVAIRLAQRIIVEPEPYPAARTPRLLAFIHQLDQILSQLRTPQAFEQAARRGMLTLASSLQEIALPYLDGTLNEEQLRTTLRHLVTPPPRTVRLILPGGSRQEIAVPQDITTLGALRDYVERQQFLASPPTHPSQWLSLAEMRLDGKFYSMADANTPLPEGTLTLRLIPAASGSEVPPIFNTGAELLATVKGSDVGPSESALATVDDVVEAVEKAHPAFPYLQTIAGEALFALEEQRRPLTILFGDETLFSATGLATLRRLRQIIDSFRLQGLITLAYVRTNPTLSPQMLAEEFHVSLEELADVVIDGTEILEETNPALRRMIVAVRHQELLDAVNVKIAAYNARTGKTIAPVETLDHANTLVIATQLPPPVLEGEDRDREAQLLRLLVERAVHLQVQQPVSEAVEAAPDVPMALMSGLAGISGVTLRHQEHAPPDEVQASLDVHVEAIHAAVAQHAIPVIGVPPIPSPALHDIETTVGRRIRSQRAVRSRT